MEISDVKTSYDGPMEFLEKNEDGLINGQRLPMQNDGKMGIGGKQTDAEQNDPDMKGGKKIQRRQTASTQAKPSGLYFDVNDDPPIHLAILFGFQIAMSNIVGCVNMTVIITQFICADQQFAASLYTTTTVMSGIGTILQTLLGVRLPIFQGPSILFALPFLNAATDPAWGCQAAPSDFNTTSAHNESLPSERLQPWIPEWRKIQGSLMVASSLQIVIGCLGLGGVLLRLMGPISITCVILLIGLSLNSFVYGLAEAHWGMACLNIVIIVILSMYVNNVKIPFPYWNKTEGCSLKYFPLFGLFPVLLSVIIGWIIAHICTVAGVFTDNPDELEYQARSDFGMDAVRDAPIAAFPYPGQYGAPSIKLSYSVILVVAVLGSILESVGDYVQTSVVCAASFPPNHAINRGIIVEGVCSLLSGVVGAGHATTSYSNNIGIIGVTKVASRLVFIIAGAMIILMGMFSKLGAVFVAIPKPVLAAPVFIALALLVGAALSNLDRVDLRSSRTQGVLGVSIMAASVFPEWISLHPEAFDTGSVDLDQTLNSILGMPIIVGAVLAIFLDMTLPGNSRLEPKEDAGSAKEQSLEGSSTERGTRQSLDASVYYPPFITKWAPKWGFIRYIPFLPNLEDKRRPKSASSDSSLQISSSRTELF